MLAAQADGRLRHHDRGSGRRRRSCTRCSRRSTSSTVCSAASAPRAWSWPRCRCSRRTPNPTEREVRLGLEGNLCRCTGYHNIVQAVLAAADSGRCAVMPSSAPGQLRRRGRGASHREGAVRRRPRGPRCAPRQARAKPVRARAHRARSTPARPPRCPASSPCSPARSSTTSGRLRCPARGPSPPTWRTRRTGRSRSTRCGTPATPVAVVVAETRARARDALEAVVVEYEELPAVGRLEDAAADADLCTPSSATNELLHVEPDPGPRRGRRRVRRTRPTSCRERYVQQRLIPMAMEPRGVVRRARAVRRQLHRVLVHPDPAHPEGAARRSSPASPSTSPRVCARGRGRLRLQAQRVRGGGALPRARRAGWPANPCGGPRSAARTRWRRSTGRGQIQDIELAADADGQGSPPCACTSSPTWARTSSW